jgi:hypothetical protein
VTKRKTYYIVNPAGAVHSVGYGHAKDRLKQPGWRVASKDEVAEYNKRKEQRFDDPIAQPFSAEPVAGPDPDAAGEETKK